MMLPSGRGAKSPTGRGSFNRYKSGGMMLPSGRGAKGPIGGDGACSCGGGKSGVKSPTGGCSCSGGRYDDGGKLDRSPFYNQGGGVPGGSDVEKLLELLSNYDQNASIGEFLNMLAEMHGQTGAGAADGLAAGIGSLSESAGSGAAEAVMRNLPPQDVESLLRELQYQGR